MLERTRKTFKLKPQERCPGEQFCTTNIQGICYQNGETLESYCKPTGCKLFYTKDGSTPVEFLAMLQAANQLRSRAKRSLSLFEDHFPFMLIKAYETAESVYELVEAEIGAETPEENENNLDVLQGGDSDAFADIEIQLRGFEEETLNDETDEMSNFEKEIAWLR